MIIYMIHVVVLIHLHFWPNDTEECTIHTWDITKRYPGIAACATYFQTLYGKRRYAGQYSGTVCCLQMKYQDSDDELIKTV